jgi:hypothetical protein
MSETALEAAAAKEAKDQAEMANRWHHVSMGLEANPLTLNPNEVIGRFKASKLNPWRTLVQDIQADWEQDNTLEARRKCRSCALDKLCPFHSVLAQIFGECLTKAELGRVVELPGTKGGN